MKLKECLELGKECGLDDVGEAYLNVQMHMTQIFNYDSMAEEMNEITLEYNELYSNGLINFDMSIEEALKLELN